MSTKQNKQSQNRTFFSKAKKKNKAKSQLSTDAESFMPSESTTIYQRQPSETTYTPKKQNPNLIRAQQTSSFSTINGQKVKAQTAHFVPKPKVIVDHASAANFQSDQEYNSISYDMKRILAISQQVNRDMTIQTITKESHERVRDIFTLDQISFFFSLAQQLQTSMNVQQKLLDYLSQLRSLPLQISEVNRDLIKHFGQFQCEFGEVRVQDIQMNVVQLYSTGLSLINSLSAEFLDDLKYKRSDQIKQLLVPEKMVNAIFSCMTTQQNQSYILQVLKQKYKAFKKDKVSYVVNDVDYFYPQFDQLGCPAAIELAQDTNHQLLPYCLAHRDINAGVSFRRHLRLLRMGFEDNLTLKMLIKEVSNFKNIINTTLVSRNLSPFKVFTFVPLPILEIKGRWQLATWDKSKPTKLEADHQLSIQESKIAYTLKVVCDVGKNHKLTLTPQSTTENLIAQAYVHTQKSAQKAQSQV